jgi:antitoxin (DNA-binding transcriptional repressor) of toxin-antitoxin stability system
VALVRRHGYHGPMEKATISQLKNRLSAYLRKVRAGATIVILDRDEPIARLERIEASAGLDDRAARLEKAGILSRPKHALRLASLRAPPPRSDRSILAALLDERHEGR